jgi:hypothetical protein
MADGVFYVRDYKGVDGVFVAGDVCDVMSVVGVFGSVLV